MTEIYTAYAVCSVLSIPVFAYANYKTGEVDKTMSVMFALMLCMAWPLLVVVGIAEAGQWLWKRAVK